jgi:Co/Zn/Cd efflux system component
LAEGEEEAENEGKRGKSAFFFFFLGFFFFFVFIFGGWDFSAGGLIWASLGWVVWWGAGMEDVVSGHIA